MKYLTKEGRKATNTLTRVLFGFGILLHVYLLVYGFGKLSMMDSTTIEYWQFASLFGWIVAALMVLMFLYPRKKE